MQVFMVQLLEMVLKIADFVGKFKVVTNLLYLSLYLYLYLYLIQSSMIVNRLVKEMVTLILAMQQASLEVVLGSL